MPSAEETTYLIEVMPETAISQDSFTSRDVDVLVSRIKENLRLTSLKSRSSFAQKIRASPYSLPSSRPWPGDCKLCSKRNNSSSSDSEQQQQQQNCHHHHHHHYRRCRKADLDLDDSYERFQALLRNGALIKEAVKRLQTCEDDVDVDRTDDEDDDLVSRRKQQKEIDDDEYFFRKKGFYYEAEDEPLPPVYQPLDL